MGKINYRQLPNGYLMAPAKGTSVPVPVGYETAPGNPFLFLPILQPCTQRKEVHIKRGCCGDIVKLTCEGRFDFVTRLECQDCGGKEITIEEVIEDAEFTKEVIEDAEFTPQQPESDSPDSSESKSLFNS